VEVVDLRTGKLTRPLTGCSQPQGLLFLAKPNLLYVASGDRGVVKVYDGATGRALKTLGSLPNAHHLRFDPEANRVYVGFGEGAMGIINPVTGVHTATLRLLGHPEAFEIEPGGSRVFVNVPKTHQVAVLDRPTQSLLEAWLLPGLEGNHALALDETHRRLYVACHTPAQLAVLDTATGTVVGQLPIGTDCDDVFVDARRDRVYAVCGEGVVCTFQRSGATLEPLPEPTRTAPGARTGCFVPEWSELFVAVPRAEGRDAEIRRYAIGN
jgi:DNA-binding beta-propeller fold protein YncE